MPDYIATPKLSDAGIITATNSTSGAPATNLQKARPKLFWRSTTTTPDVDLDLGSAKTVDTGILGFINGKSGDTFRLRGATSQANLSAAPTYDSNTLYPTGVPIWPAGSDLSAYLRVHHAFTFAQQTLRWWRWSFGFSGNSDGYVQASRAFVARRIEPANGCKPGWSPGIEEPVAETLDLGGEESPRVMGVKREAEVTWEKLTHAEQESLYSTLLERGSAKDFALVITTPETIYPMTKIYVGRCKRMLTFPNTFRALTSEVYFSLALNVKEMAPIEMA